jgi:hypothetical protein
MDRTQQRSAWARRATCACLTATLAVFGCAHEDQPVGPPEVHVQHEHREVVASAKILRNGEEVGALKTIRVTGGGHDRVVQQVQDLHLNSLGYIDAQNCAWRLTAHTGSELVASSSDQRRNVAAILGAYNANIELVEEGPAATVEKDRAPASRRSATR